MTDPMGHERKTGAIGYKPYDAAIDQFSLAVVKTFGHARDPIQLIGGRETMALRSYRFAELVLSVKLDRPQPGTVEAHQENVLISLGDRVFVAEEGSIGTTVDSIERKFLADNDGNTYELYYEGNELQHARLLGPGEENDIARIIEGGSLQ